MYQITNNPYGFNIDDIFVVGKRNNNAKRSFLFISKLLGKHISVNPEVVRTSGYLLSSLKYGFDNSQYVNCIKNGNTPDYTTMAEDEDILTIGFCETATGLGMAVASSIKGCVYQTTTREKIKGMKKILTFEEAHSHATTHNMFSDTISLENFKKVILVDDEITTGNSLLNLMEQIEKVHHMEEYNIMTILDWRDKEQREKFFIFAEKNKTKVNVYSLIDGYINSVDNVIYTNDKIKEIGEILPIQNLNVFNRMAVATNDCGITKYICESGRFGICQKSIEEIEEYAEKATNKILETYVGENVKSILILGHGENIYIPSRVASHLQKKKLNVMFKTTSLSPIYCDGVIINNAVSFFDRGMRYYYYNSNEFKSYDKIVMLLDSGIVPKLDDKFTAYYL